MTDDKGMVRAYSQDRHIYQHDSISVSRKASIEIKRTSEKYYSNRNCPEIISLFALQNRQLENREKRIYNSKTNDEHYLNMLNYPIQSRAATPNLIQQAIHLEDKETKFPKVTQKATPTPTNRFPTYTSQSTSVVHNNDPIISTSVKSMSSSINNRVSLAKMPSVSKEKKSNTQQSNVSRRPDWHYSY